jgi:flagellar biosynthesis component FlhA
MRVSKTVREYIEKQVCARYPKSENELKAEQIKDLVNQANQEMTELMDKAKREISNQIIAKYGLTEEMGEQSQSAYQDYKFNNFNSPLEIKANTDRQNRRQAVNQKIEDIIVTLELGGTKADLEKMLAEI